MSESQPEQSRSAIQELICSDEYQTSVVRLLYNCAAKTSQDNSTALPTAAEGERSFDFDPLFEDDFDDPDEPASWETVSISLYPARSTGQATGHEMLATIELIQDVDDTGLDLIKQYEVYFANGQYVITKQHYLVEYENISEPNLFFDNRLVANINDIAELDEIIDNASC